MGETEFVRHQSGRSVEVIHRWECGAVQNMKNPLPWNWAEKWPARAWVALPHFRPCERCCRDLVELREKLLSQPPDEGSSDE